MNLYFNDLTVDQDSDLNFESLRTFARTFYALSNRTGEQRVWAPRSVKDRLRALPWKSNFTLWSWALSTFSLKTEVAPYEPEEVVDRFLRSSFEIARDEGCVRCDQMGLAVVSKPQHARESLTVGFPSDPFWTALHYTVREREAQSNVLVREHSALCVVSAEQVDDEDVRDWCQESYDIQLPKTELLPEQKNIHLRDDHGKDVLDSFARRLVQSPYVVQVVNSLPFNTHTNRLVESCSPDGLINFRLHWDQRGIGLVVKTTGTTLDQTERIAKALARKYDL